MSAKKSRFDGLDVAAMTSHLKRTMLGFKLANVYDGNALGVSGTASGGGSDGAKGVYMFKLADASGGGGSSSATNAANTANAAAPTNSSAGVEDEDGDTAAAKEATKEEEVTQETTTGQDQKRAMLLIESGVRFHPTT